MTLTPDVHFFRNVFHRAVVVAKFHADSTEQKLFGDFKNLEGVVCDCLNQLFLIFAHF